MLCHMEEKVLSLDSSLLDEFLPSPEIDMEDFLNCQDPPDFDWFSIGDPNQRYVKVEFAALVPPSIPMVEAHASNEYAMSEYCTFAQAVLSLPPMEGFDVDFDLGIEQGDSGQSDRPRARFILYDNGTLWHQLMVIKDNQPELRGGSFD